VTYEILFVWLYNAAMYIDNVNAESDCTIMKYYKTDLIPKVT
jgi:hypothetical protein